MPDIEIADAFEKTIRKNIVLIKAEFSGPQESTVLGTGSVFAYVRNPAFGNMAFVVTAAHVIRVSEGQTARYVVTRAGDPDPPRTAVFTYPNADAGGPRAFWHKPDPPVDVGALIVPSTCIDGRSFLDPSELPSEVCPGPGIPMISRTLLLGEGTRVAWAGFPATALGAFGTPILCYYEGVVAHTRNDKQVPVYLLDGHNDRGVSGGPVWWWNDSSKSAELVGVITQYVQSEGQGEVVLPGFVWATAINPFRMMLEDVWLRRPKKSQ